MRGGVDATTHELLVRTKPGFSGVDSFRVIVADEYTVGRAGQDTLRVIVAVNEIPDPPRFRFDPDEVVRLPSGQRLAWAIDEIVSDIDTPLDSLRITWNRDLGGTFTAALEGDSLTIQAPGFPAQGLFVFTVTDPEGGLDRAARRVTARVLSDGSSSTPCGSRSSTPLPRHAD